MPKIITLSLILLAYSLNSVANNNINLASQYFDYNGLSESECVKAYNYITISKADLVMDKQLNKIIYEISAECGYSDVEEIESYADYDLDQSQVTLYKSNAFEDFYILWDGNHITLNQQAKSTYDLTVAKESARIVNINNTHSDIDTNTENLFVRARNKIKSVRKHLKKIKSEGKSSAIISMIAWHSRATYTRKKINELNEIAAGFGVERYVINESGNRESVAFTMFLDSHSDPQVNFSYEWSKKMVGNESLSAWLGVASGIAFRSDFNYMPVPFAFPTVGVKAKRVALRAVLIPSLRGVNNGNVVFVSTSVDLN